MTTAPTPKWALPEGKAANAPPERLGISRDGIRLLVATHGEIRHDIFRRLAHHLAAGDVVVVNTSATRAAAIDATWRNGNTIVHLSTPLNDENWVVELRRPDGLGPIREASPGDMIRLPGGGRLRLIAPMQEGNRLWRASLHTARPVSQYMAARGRPISYGYGDGKWPLPDYQTIFARPDDPTGASAEMPSAGRPFTHALVTDLIRRGITVVPVALHAGVSSLERDEAPLPERFVIPVATADAVNAVRHRGGRVVAIGTTVTRALESVAEPDGSIRPGEGWTDLVLDISRPARTVNGLVTGWHHPDTSHLHLLEAVAGPALLYRAYRNATDHGYLWHEFGDSCLLLP